MDLTTNHNIVELSVVEKPSRGDSAHNQMGTDRPGKMFFPMSGICALCTKANFYITFKPGVGPLNKKNEMLNNCRHKRRVLLCQKDDQDLDQG